MNKFCLSFSNQTETFEDESFVVFVLLKSVVVERSVVQELPSLKVVEPLDDAGNDLIEAGRGRGGG